LYVDKYRYIPEGESVINTVAIEIFPPYIHCSYATLSMYNLRLNCSVSSSHLSTNTGMLVVAVVDPGINVTLYRPGVKSASATIQHIIIEIINYLTYIHINVYWH